MKDDFNIENLERKNIYKSSNDFYQEVQENVLRETFLKIEKNKTPKVKQLNFKWWAVAASILLMISVGLVWTNFQKEMPNETNFVENKTSVKTQSQIQVSEKPSVENLEIILNTENQLVENKTLEKSSSFVSASTIEEPNKVSCKLPVPSEKSNSVEESQDFIAENKTEEIFTEEAEEMEVMETLLSENLPDEELAELTENMENDIYLELYN